MLASVAAFAASSAAAATTLPGYYWTSARMTAAVKFATWEIHAGMGLHCDNQGLGACDFTVTCRGQFSNPTTTPSPRDVLAVGPHGLRFRYFHCIATSPCFLSGSWWQDYRTNGDGSASLSYDARHIRPNGGAELRASPQGC